MTDQGKKSAVHRENPVKIHILAAILSLACVAGTKKEGRGGEGEKCAKRKREREPFLLSSITSSTPPSGLTDDACHILSPSV